MYRALPLILARVFGPPLLISHVPTSSFSLDGFLLGLQAAMRHRGSVIEAPGFNLPDFRGEAGVTVETPVDERPRGYRIDHGVATVPIRGVLVRRSGQVAPDSTPLQSYENLSRVIASAQRDSRVRGTLLDIDSPGGEAGGVFDLAGEIRRAAQLKPIWAIANDDSLSAAYVLAAASHRIWATQTAALGSLGVVALHADQSALDAEEGIKYTYVYRGARKIDANPHSHLSAEAQIAIQGEVDRLYDKLVAIVADHRAMEPARIRGTEAGVYFGERAQAQGLVDQIGTRDEAHAALAQHVQPKGSRMETPTVPPPSGELNNDGMHNNVQPTPISDNVVQMRIDDARAAAKAEAVEIAALCDLAGLPHLTSSYIAEGLNVKAVMQKLQAARAAESAKHGVVAIDTSTPPFNASAELRKAHDKRLRDMYPTYRG